MKLHIPFFIKFARIIRTKLSFAIAVLLLSATCLNLSILYLFSHGPLEQAKTLVIERKLSTYNISNKLAENGVIKHPRVFFLIAKLYGKFNSLKSGEYVFTSNITPIQVLKIISSGESVIHRLVIPEGLTVNEILKIIDSEDLLEGQVKTNIPEGFLMPATYYFSYGDTKAQVVAKMLSGMSIALDKVMQELPKNLKVQSRMEVLTLASIVEKEAGNNEERPMIAAVFLNRLQKGMKLQADPTVAYALTQGQGKLNRLLTRKDLMIDSKYNTYKVKGLPPTPIACPGLKSLQAIAAPAQTNALYFVVNCKGGHNFANTLEQHNNNVKSAKSLCLKRQE